MRKPRSSEYLRYYSARGRCTNRKNKSWKRYGGRGIKMCERWLNSSAAFLSDMGPCPPGFLLDRIDNDGDYCPENCRWTDASTSARNQQGRDPHRLIPPPRPPRPENSPWITSKSRWIEYQGRRQTLSEWARELGLRRDALYARLFIHGWPLEKAMTHPYRSRNRPRKS
jgi:hypothetical protein